MSFFIINKEVCHWSCHIFLLVVKILLILRIVIFIGDTLSVVFLAIYLSTLFMFPPMGSFNFSADGSVNLFLYRLSFGVLLRMTILIHSFTEQYFL